MTKETKVKIFLAEERGLNETECFSSQNTFNFGNYFQEHKQPFGDIYLVNDDSLDAGCSLSMHVEEYSYVILLPVMGAIEFKDSAGNDNLLAAGQIQILGSDKGEKIVISNPFKEGVVNFLQIWIKIDRAESARINFLFSYNVNNSLNELIRVFPDKPDASLLPFAISIGKFSGRGETSYKLKSKNPGAFLFVIEGAFEVEARLLHAGDGLALWNTREVEIEAFSNQAIILLIEQSFEEV